MPPPERQEERAVVLLPQSSTNQSDIYPGPLMYAARLQVRGAPCHTAGLASASPWRQDHRPTNQRALYHAPPTNEGFNYRAHLLVDRPQRGQDRGVHTRPWTIWARRVCYPKAGVGTVFAIPARVCSKFTTRSDTTAARLVASCRQLHTMVRYDAADSKRDRAMDAPDLAQQLVHPLARQQAVPLRTLPESSWAKIEGRGDSYSHGGRQVSPT